MDMQHLLSRIAQEHGTPCFVYDFDQIRQRTAAVREAFGGRFRISYAVKCNPNPAILRRFRGCCDQLDCSSRGEVIKAIQAGWPADLLSFTGPAKRDPELREAVSQRIAHVVVESVGEAERLDAIARAANARQAVLIRIAPAKVPAGFGSRMAGKPSQFGVDEEEIDDAVRRIAQMGSLDLHGFHVYSGTQCLNAGAVAENYLSCIDLFRRIAGAHNLFPTTLIFGSGLGIPYHEQDQPLDLAAVAARVNPALIALRAEPRFARAELVLETGRYLVGEAGVYLTRIVSAKHSRGADIRICDGGMNHHNGACGHLGSVLHRNYRMYKLGDETPAPESLRPYDLFGPLCTSIDHLAHSTKLPELNVGDIVAVRCSGAYGPTASPIYFISHDPPKEILVETIGGERRVEDFSQFTTSST